MAPLTALKAVVLDLDGVLYVEDDPVPGAVEAVAGLRARGLGLRFATNTTTRPRRGILERLQHLGFDVEPDELVTPAALAVRGVTAADAAMVGDDVESDVGGALAAGMAGVLVRTGKFREDRLRSSGVEPTEIVDSIADVPGLLGA